MLTVDSTSGVRAVRRDRRRSRRWPLHAEIEVLEPVRGRGVAINGSRGGMRIAVDCRLSEDDVCVIRTRYGEGVTRTGRVRVVWSKPVRDGWIVGLALLAPL